MKIRLPILPALVMSGLVIAADLWTKNIYFKTDASSGAFVGSWIQMTSHKNFGLIADLAIPSIVTIPIMCVTILLLLYVLIRTSARQRLLETMALGLILGGAIGNLTDRLLFGYVRDWILFFNRSAMNVADLCILLGLLLYLIDRLTLLKKSTAPLSTT